MAVLSSNKNHAFQLVLLLFVVSALSAGVILATSKGSYTNPKASDKEMVVKTSPSPSPKVTPKLYTK